LLREIEEMESLDERKKSRAGEIKNYWPEIENNFI